MINNNNLIIKVIINIRFILNIAYEIILNYSSKIEEYLKKFKD